MAKLKRLRNKKGRFVSLKGAFQEWDTDELEEANGGERLCDISMDIQCPKCPLGRYTEGMPCFEDKEKQYFEAELARREKEGELV